MNKKLIAIALVLVLAVSGVFAAYDVTVPGSVNAYLYANKPEFLRHGFNIEGIKYQASVEIYDAFVTPPTFKYGYETNAKGTFSFRMVVGNFIHEVSTNPQVKIASVTIGTTPVPVTTPTEGDPYYEIFTENNATTLGSLTHADEKTIVITPASATGTDHLGTQITAGQHTGDALAGNYTATIQFSIAAS